jgi:hypothetical protein
MNILNLLILIVLIITIEPFIRIVLDNGLVFIKPENLSKTELVEKFKELSSSKSLKDLKNIKNEDKKDEDKITIKDFLKSNYFRLSTFILKYKNLITFMNKIALFTILIKYFRKFKLMRFIFRIINYIFLSIFGIFISDVYGLKEVIAGIEYYWMEYINFIHESKIYKMFVKIFYVVNDINKSEIIENKSEIINDKVVENKFESKIINSELPSSGSELKNEKIIHDKTSWGDEKENWFRLNKDLLILGLSIVSLGLIYIYWDSIIELFKNVKPDLGKDEDGSNATNSPIFTSHQEEYEKYFKELETNEELYDLDQIKSQDKVKSVDYTDVQKTKWEDSPTTPKPSFSKLPERDPVILPVSRK